MGKFVRRFLGRLAALADKPDTDWLLPSGLAAEPEVRTAEIEGIEKCNCIHKITVMTKKGGTHCCSPLSP